MCIIFVYQKWVVQNVRSVRWMIFVFYDWNVPESTRIFQNVTETSRMFPSLQKQNIFLKNMQD